MLAGALAGSLIGTTPYYGVMFQDADTTRSCPQISWLDPMGPMADAGVRVGDCLRADETSFDEDICPALTSSPAGGVLRLHGKGGRTFDIAPADCASANYKISVELFVKGERRVVTELSRDTKLSRWLELQSVANMFDCGASFVSLCKEFSVKKLIELPPAVSFRQVGCFPFVRITCSEPPSTLVTLWFGDGAADILLKPGEALPAGFDCAPREQNPRRYDCKPSKKQK